MGHGSPSCAEGGGKVSVLQGEKETPLPASGNLWKKRGAIVEGISLKEEKGPSPRSKGGEEKRASQDRKSFHCRGKRDEQGSKVTC